MLILWHFIPVTVQVNERTTQEKVELLLQNLLWDGTYNPMKILRLKASVNLTDERTILIQGVNDTYDIVPAKEKRDDSIFIIIAKFIDSTVLNSVIYSTLKWNGICNQLLFRTSTLDHSLIKFLYMYLGENTSWGFTLNSVRHWGGWMVGNDT